MYPYLGTRDRSRSAQGSWEHVVTIGLDARIASYNNSGISRYFRGLLSGLATAESPFTFEVYLSSRRPFTGSIPARFRVHRLRTPPHNRFEEVLLPLELRRGKCRLLHAMDFFTPVGSAIPQILSVYDLYFLREPQSLDRSSYRHYSKLVRYAQSAAHIICSSEATKKDLLDLAGVPGSKASVVYPGPSLELHRIDMSETGSGSEPFMLCVGTIEPRKNLARLFQAYALASERSTAPLPTLLLAGRCGYRAQEILDSLSSLGLDSRVRYLGEIPDNELAKLYREALFLVYPSLYEGFGFPLVEAMAYGVPVLTSDISSIPEVVGDAAYLVNPEDIESIAGGLRALSGDPELRARLSALGRLRCERFSWARTASETLDVYRNVLA